MVNCPNCGIEVATAAKSWPVSLTRQGESEVPLQSCVEIFKCPKCKTKLRSTVEFRAKPVKSTETTRRLQRTKSNIA